MTTDEGSEELREPGARLMEELRSLPSQLRHYDAFHGQHGDFCDRAAQFPGYLEGAVLLTERRRYAQAFSLLRSALDHWAADLVIMLGERFVQHYDKASEDVRADAVERWKRGELPLVVGEPSLMGKGRSKLRIVRRGLTSEDGAIVLHPMYFEADKFDPFFGPPDEQPGFADWLGGSQAQDHANEQRQRYNAFFRWGALVDSLVLNELVDDRHRVHLNVHHRFLSAFVHSHHAAHQLLATAQPSVGRAEPHATEELILLYVVQLGARYLRGFVAMVDRPPRVGIANRDNIDQLVALGLDKAAHLWFLTYDPHGYDRHQELLARAASQEVLRRSTTADLMALAPGEVRYYRNPLDRLRRMHDSFTEMVTGFTYVSPWV